MEDFQHLHQQLDEKKKPELKLLQKDSETTIEKNHEAVTLLENKSIELFSVIMQKQSNGLIDLKIDFPQQGLNLKDIITKLEDTLILESLKRTNGNKNQASKLLGLNRTTLIEKMKKKKMPLEYRMLNESKINLESLE